VKKALLDIDADIVTVAHGPRNTFVMAGKNVYETELATKIEVARLRDDLTLEPRKLIAGNATTRIPAIASLGKVSSPPGSRTGTI
jgi:hypothetical protein